MKALHIASCLLLVAAASAAYVVFPPAPKAPTALASTQPAAEPQPVALADEPQSNKDSVAVQSVVQPIEERGDAMLFEIDALQNTPFDQSVMMPFD